MPAYVIAEIEVTDPQGYEEYRQLAGPSITAYGGKFIARGGALEKLEGNWSPKRVVILEFPTLAQAKTWYSSPEYTRAKAVRWRTARTAAFVAVEGV